MDPASAIIGIASGAAALVAMTGQIVTYLINLRDDCRNTEVILLDLALTCQAYESAWTRVRTWLLESCDPHMDESDPIIQELQNFLEGGKVMMELIRADLNRISSKPKRGNWWRGARHGAQLLVHKNTVLAHRDRIHCQNTSLHLLISCSKLPSKPLQEAAIDVLRPKFRKDEESAWTIVKSRLSLQSSKAWPTTLASSRRFSVDSIASVLSYRNLQNKAFTFEDELFLGPVYKRLLIGRLCENPVGRVPSKSPASIPSAQTIVEEASGRRDQGSTTLYDDDTLALELRQQGIFSRSCQEDYYEFVDHHRPRKMKRRHLPLASVLCHQYRKHHEQGLVDDLFFDAVRCRKLGDIASALDDGADINTRRDGQTALELCVRRWATSTAENPDQPSEDTTIAEFLMLYKETHIPYGFDAPLTILHLCMHIGATAEFMRPFFDVESKADALSHLDMFGRTVLHTAILCSTTGPFALLQLKELFGDDVVVPSYVYDRNGLSAYKFAAQRGTWDHVSALAMLAGVLPTDYTCPNTGESDPQMTDSIPEDGNTSSTNHSWSSLQISNSRSSLDQTLLSSNLMQVNSASQATSNVPPEDTRRRWSISLAQEVNPIDSMYYFPRRSSFCGSPSTQLSHESSLVNPQRRQAASQQLSGANPTRVNAATLPPCGNLPVNTPIDVPLFAGFQDPMEYWRRLEEKRREEKQRRLEENRRLLQEKRRLAAGGMRLVVMNPDSDET